MKFGISYGCLVMPTTLSSKKVAAQVVEHLEKHGLFFQGLPFRQFWKLPAQCRYVEEPWPGIISVGKVHRFGEGATHIDKVVFAAPRRCVTWQNDQIVSGAQLIGHEPGTGISLLEINPLLGSPSEIRRLFEKNRLLSPVLDTCHLRQFGREVAEEFITQLASRAQVVHVQPLRHHEEYGRFILGKETELEQMLRLVVESGFHGDIVIETSPFFHYRDKRDRLFQLLDPTYLIGSLEWMLGRVKQVLEA